jgi:hypothetical protein
MYTVLVSVEGIAPLMQHRYPLPDFGDLSKGGKKKTGEQDYSQEWREYLYLSPEGDIYQPATHFDGAMVKAAAGYKIQGARGKTYKDLFKGNVFVSPDAIYHGVKVPDELDADADKPLYLDVRPVVIQRARVVRVRPCFSAGWKLDFEITVLDDQLPKNVLNEVLTLAGRTVGVGDFRPRFGRFMVTRFEDAKH